MAFQIPVHLSDTPSLLEDINIKDEQISIIEDEGCVSSKQVSVSKSDIRSVIKKVAQILATQGIPCCECPRTLYKLYPLSDWKEGNILYSLKIACGNGDIRYQFEVTLHPVPSPGTQETNAEGTHAHTVRNERRNCNE